MNIEIPFYILSAASSTTCTARENAHRHKTLRRQLRGYGFAVADCEGCYNGVTESSLLVLDDKPIHGDADFVRHSVLRLARAWGQESILEVDANRGARLTFMNNDSPISLGKFTAVMAQYAKHESAWTRRNGQYYCCIPL